jgi:hypothetical protein
MEVVENEDSEDEWGPDGVLDVLSKTTIFHYSLSASL